MKANIDVTSRQEADEIRLGLSDQRVRAFVRMVGIMSQLSSDDERWRVLRQFTDVFGPRQIGEPS